MSRPGAPASRLDEPVPPAGEHPQLVGAHTGANPMSTGPVVVIACGATKTDHPRPAAELYTGALFTAARRAVLADGRAWLILSAEHGLVHPLEVLAPYERVLGNQPDDLARLAGLIRTQNPPAVVEAWTPTRYTTALAQGGVQVAGTPLRGLGIGQQIGWLTNHARQCQPAPTSSGTPTGQGFWPPTGLVYSGSITALRGQPAIDLRVTRTVDDGSLLGLDLYDVALANGARLTNVRATSLIPDPGPGLAGPAPPGPLLARTPTHPATPATHPTATGGRGLTR